MAIIPDEVPLGAARTPTARPQPASFGDLGLGQVAQTLQGIAEGKQRVADAEASAALVGMRTRFDPGFRQAAETYDGHEPGFAQQQVDAWDTHAAEARKGLSEDAAMAFDAANLHERLKVVDQAGAVEASASGEIVRRQRAADSAGRVSATATQFLVDTQKAAEEAYTSGDPSSPDFLKVQAAALDERIKVALDSARPEDRPALQAQLANQRGDAVIGFATAGRKLLAARVVTSAQQGVGALVNQVTADPGFLDQALKTVPTVLVGLPRDVREKMEAALPGDLAAAALTGLQDREDYHGLQARLDDPRFRKILDPAAFTRFASIAKTALTSEERQLAAQTVSSRLDAELSSIQETGEGTGFDPASLLQVFGPVDGPAKVAAAQRAIEDARLTYRMVGNAAGLTTKDLNARLELLKPVAGDPDYARKRALFGQAVEVAQRQMALRATDPAQAIQADKASTTLWREAADGAPASAQAWAADALRRQTALGIPDGQQAILPVADAKRLATSVTGTKDPVSKARALSEIYAYAQRFGGNGGRVLMELQRAGLPPAEAAVINAVDGDPIVVGAFTQALDRAPKVKLDKAAQDKIADAVADEVKPLVQSYAGTTDGIAYVNALTYAVGVMAKANMGDDQTARDAAKAAAKHFVGRYVFDERNGVRIPVEQARREIPVVPARSLARGDLVYDEVGLDPDKPTKPRPADAVTAVRVGTFRALRDLVGPHGTGLADVGDKKSPLSEDQRRARYIDQVAGDGRWVTTPDDSGQALMLRSPAGGFVPVFGRDGKPVVMSWSQIFARAGRP